MNGPGEGLEVRVERLTRRWGRHVALRRVSVALPAGTCTLLLGGNGSGKSTLLSILAGRLAPSRGDVRYGEVPWADADEATRARIGVLGHGAMLYRDLSGRENLDFAARLHGLDDRAARVSAALGRVEMSDAADRPVGKCSQGMVRRLALARALLSDPDLVLLDEPFAGLDKAAVERLVASLVEVKERGATVVVATHAPAPLAELCDRVAVLCAGRLVHEGPWAGAPAELEALMLEHLGGTA